MSKIFYILIALISFSVFSNGKENTPDKFKDISDYRFSIYHIGTGSLVYTNSTNHEASLYNLTAYYVDKTAAGDRDKLLRAVWRFWKPNPMNNELHIQNEFNGLCIKYYTKDHVVVQSRCDSYNKETLWTMEDSPAIAYGMPTQSFILRSVYNPKMCLYGWPGDQNYYTYAGDCEEWKNLADWTLVPPVERGYYSPANN